MLGSTWTSLHKTDAAVFTFDASGLCAGVNTRGAGMLQLSRAEVVGRSIGDLVRGADASCWTATHARALAGEVVAGQLCLVRKDGCTVRSTVLLCRDAESEVRAYLWDTTNVGAPDDSVLHRLERAEALAAASFDGIGISQDGLIVEANDQLARLLGCARRELIGQSVMTFVAPEWRERVAQAVRSADTEPYDHLATRANGSVLTVEARGKTVHYRGRDARVTAIRDVSEQRRLADAVRSIVEVTIVVGEEFFPALVRGVADVLGVQYAMVGELVESDDPSLAQQALGRVRTVAMWGQGRLLEPLEYMVTNTATERVLTAGACFHSDNVRQRFPDDAVLQRFSADAFLGVPLRGAHGKALGVLLTWQSGKLEHVELARSILTLFAGRAAAELGRRRADSALLRSEASLRATIDATPHVGIQWYDADGRTLLWNRASEAIFGWSSDEALGKTLDSLMLDPTEGAEFLRRFGETLRTAEPAGPSEYSFRRRDGTQGQCLSTLFRISDADGQPRVACMDIDISEWRRAERQRSELELQLRHTRQLETLGTLASGIAHDFNNILTAIFAYNELARLAGNDPDQVREHLAHLHEAAVRARDLVRQILSISRRHTQAHSAVQLQQVVREAVKFVRSTLPSTIEIESSLDEDTPAVMASSIQMHQVVLNLCMNAAQAVQGGPGVIRVVLETALIDANTEHAPPELPLGKYARLEVTDTGHGMDPETLHHIFEPFFTTKGNGEGTGLGLAVTRGIVRDHQGAIRVTSAPGRGASFQVYLPAHVDEPTPREEPAPPPRSGQGERVLLVDDEPSLCFVSTAVLERFGYRVTSHTDPRHALKAFERAPLDFALVVTDLTMPHIKGTDLAQRMLKIRPGLPILLVSGISEGIGPEEVAALGLAGFVSKPFLPVALAEAVERALHSTS